MSENPFTPEWLESQKRSGRTFDESGNHKQSMASKPVKTPTGTQQTAQAKKMSQHDKLIARFLKVWGECGGLALVAERQFHPFRKWRFDFSHLNSRIAIEIDGGVWTGGAHVRGMHFNSDAEKRNAAQMLGWKVFCLTTNMLKPEFVKPIADHLKKTDKIMESFGI